MIEQDELNRQTLEFIVTKLKTHNVYFIRNTKDKTEITFKKKEVDNEQAE